jgi:choline dehydrogenase-like flavoprotein
MGPRQPALSDLDFKAASLDGYGEDWPISYKDVEPYYDLVEEYVGICGQGEGLAHLPDGHFLPPMPLNCVETHFRNRVKAKLGWVAMPTRSANLTKAIHGRTACHYCHCTHIPNAMVYKVLMDSERNRARGVLYVDRITREPKEVQARAVVLCAQSLESVPWAVERTAISRSWPASPR